MLGREVDVEESAIAEEFQKLAQLEREQTLPALEKARAYNLPVVQSLSEWVESLQAVIGSQSDDCVRMLAGEGKSLRDQRAKAQTIRSFLTDDNIEIVRRARTVLHDQVPLLARSTGEDVPQAKAVSTILSDLDIPNHVKDLAGDSDVIDSAYRTRFADRHQQRLTEYRNAIQLIQEHSDYRAVDVSEAELSLAALVRRAVETFELPPYGAADRITGATLATLEDDLELLSSLQAGALARLAQLRDAKKGTEEAVEVVRLGDFLPKNQPLTDFSDAEIDEALEKLKQKLYALRELKRRVLWD
jgi:hypothetical protein